MKTEVLKKNIFWILAGVAPFLTFLTFLFVFLFVGGEVATKSEAITKDLTDLGNKKAKGVKPLATMDKQKDVIAQQKQKLWEANWDQQLKLFTWPTASNGDLKAFEQKYQKFGEKMSVFNDEFSTFKTKSVYEGVYERLAESIKPTLFAGNNWRGVLRHVSDWTDKTPTNNQVWLALEDMWVQKGLLDPIVAVNASAAVFAPIDDGKDPLKRKFRSRVWDLDLEVPKEGKQAGKIILAKLTNRTDRMQLLGNGKTMNLRVWLADGGTPILFRIEAAFLKANEVMEVKPVPNLHAIPDGTEVKKLARVEQILDARTVPVRRIDVVQLGKVDARHAAAALKQPKFFPEDAVVDATAGGPGGMPGGPGGEGSAGGMGAMMGSRGAGSPGGLAGGAAANFGIPTAVLDGNKKRYIDVTDQVRRMPVGMVLVVDQMFLQDTLVAFANSSLRFQVTQYHWKRFRGTLSNATDPSGGGDGGELSGNPGGPGGMMPGMSGMMPGGPGGGMMPGTSGMMPGRGGFQGSSGFGPPGGGSSEGGFGSGGFGSGGFGGGGFGGGGGAAVTEAQATSGLVELTVYGIITLYEKYDTKVADGTAPPVAPTPPAPPAPPKPPANKDGD